ncbi:hypothetical protein ABE288_20880 [Bacillus salipaludis]
MLTEVSAVAKFILVKKVTTLTSRERIRVFIVDDSTYDRSRSKNLELLDEVKDHTTGKFVRGFRMITFGLSDGHSFVPEIVF